MHYAVFVLNKVILKSKLFRVFSCSIEKAIGVE